MHLAPDYSPDILISYSHGDVDHTGQSELKAWSQRFARTFASELRLDVQFNDAAVFFDESNRAQSAVNPTLGLTEQLRATAEGAGLLMILMSPHYLRSSWCDDERNWWLAQPGAVGDALGRIFVVRIWPTEDKDWPKELRDERGHALVGVWFHTRDAGSAAIRPFGWLERTDDRNEYAKQLLDLVGRVSLQLRTLKSQLDALRQTRLEAERLAAEGGQTLYLYAREGHEEVWRQTYDSLGHLGYIVVPTEPEPRAATPARVREISEYRARELAACDALLLLGNEDGHALDGDMLTVGRQSRHLARAVSGKLLPCAVLATGSASIGTEQRLGLARKLGIDWINVAAEGPQGVRDWLRKATARL